MVQVIPQVNRFSELGKSFGEGLGAQIPKEVERYRLKQGLEDFEKNAGNLTPLQQAIDLYKRPGVTPEMIYTLVPLLREQQKRNVPLNFGQENQSAPISGQQQPVGMQQGQTPISPRNFGQPSSPEIQKDEQGKGLLGQIEEQSNKPSLKSREATQAQLTPFIEPTPAEKWKRAQEISQLNPQAFPTPETALPVVQNEIDTQRANLSQLQQTAGAADTLQGRLKNGLEKFWGKDNTEKGIPSFAQNALLRHSEADLADPNNKMSEQSIIEKWGRIGRDIAKKMTNITNMGFSQKWLGDTKSNINAIEEGAKIFKEIGSEEDYANFLESTLDFSPELSARFAYDVKPDVLKLIKNLPAGMTEFREEGQAKQRENLKKFAWDVAKKISPQDSLYAIAQRLPRKGYDISEFMNEMKELTDLGILKPSELQSTELTKVRPIIKSMYDIYLDVMLGE